MTAITPTPKAHADEGRWRVLGWQVSGLVIVLAAWWLVTDVLKIWPPYVFPSPTKVWEQIAFGLWGTGPHDGKLLQAIGNSVTRIGIGFGLSLIAGGVLGLLMGSIRALRLVLGGYLTGIQSVPSIAWVPFAILFFGLNERAILAVVILEGAIPVALALSGAIANVYPAWRVAARTLGAQSTSYMLKVMLPASLPQFTGGLRSAFSFAWRAMIGAELLTPNIGLGQQLEIGRNTSQADLVLATIILIGIMGAVVDTVLRAYERKIRRDYGLEVSS